MLRDNAVAIMLCLDAINSNAAIKLQNRGGVAAKKRYAPPTRLHRDQGVAVPHVFYVSALLFIL